MIWQESFELTKKHYKVDSNEKLAKIIFSKIKSQSKQEYYIVAPSAGNIAAELKKSLAEYNENIKQAKSPEDKLKVIIKCVTSCNRLHPFSDGNIRVFAILLMNRLLLQNGFPPVTYHNPNIFDGFSQDEIMKIVKEGMQTTLSIINGEKNIFNYKSENIPKKNQDYYKSICKNFTEKMEKEFSRSFSINNDDRGKGMPGKS